MSIDDTIRYWKDPDSRGDSHLGIDHPAGEIELASPESYGAEGTITPTLTIGTQAISCWPSCERSAWVGTCAFPASVGCCEQVV